jgi:hypothetical protein
MRKFKFIVREEYKKIIENEKLPIGDFCYETYMGADIVFIKNSKTNLWDITVYKRIEGTPRERLMVISAFASIKRMEKQWYEDETSPFDINGPLILKEFNISRKESEEVAESVLCDVRNSLHYIFEANFLLSKNYLTMDDLRELAKYYQSTSMMTPMLFQFLSTMAAIRENGGSVSYFNDSLISLKRYELLKIIDIEVDILNKNKITKKDIKSIFNLLYPDLDKITKVLEMTSKMALGTKENRNNEYHVALSFAGEDRPIAKKFADALTLSGYKVFYDEYEQAALWGKDLYSHLSDIYGKRAKYCLMLISKYYAEKLWTTHERKSAQAKAFEQSEEYILPLRLDNTEISGVNSTVGYVDYEKVGFEETLSLLKQKLAE